MAGLRDIIRTHALRRTLKRRVRPLEPLRFTQTHAARRLYESSILRGGHLTGFNAVTGGLAYVNTIRHASPSERVTSLEYLERFSAVLLWVECVFAHLPIVDAIVFFGSALRGKKDPNDYDFSLILPASTQEVLSSTEASFSRLEAHFHSIGGRPVKVRTVDSYDERPQLSVNFVERCPYAVFSRSGPGLLALFGNFSGKKYLEDREL